VGNERSLEKDEKVAKEVEDIEIVLMKIMTYIIKKNDVLLHIKPNSIVRQQLTSFFNLNVAFNIIIAYILPFFCNIL